MTAIIKKRFDIHVTQADKTWPQTFDLDKTITHVRGILFASDRDDLLYYRGSQKVELNNQEVFPENYQSKLLMSGINVPPNLRYYKLRRVPVGNGKLKVEYKNTSDSRTGFEPYTISVYVDCEIAEA